MCWQEDSLLRPLSLVVEGRVHLWPFFSFMCSSLLSLFEYRFDHKNTNWSSEYRSFHLIISLRGLSPNTVTSQEFKDMNWRLGT